MLNLKKTMREQQEYAHELLGRIQSLFENRENKSSVPALDTKIMDGIVQLYAIGTSIEDASNKNEINTEDISQIGEYGFNLLAELLQWAHASNNKQFKKISCELILSLSLWIIAHKGELQSLEPTVDSLAQITNKTASPERLTELVYIMTDIINGCSSMIKNDAEQTNSLRPWRVLHLNRAITATRSNDTPLMRSVFQELVAALPIDAADFFAQGMHEMDRLNYPVNVKEVVKEYFDLYSRPKMN